MVTSQFGTILKEMEPFFNCPLEPDSNNSCLITMGIGISIQLELDKYGLLLIGCRLGILPMSRYRDNLIQLALKCNHLDNPSQGIFGFSQKSNQLILFTRLDPASYSTSRILTLLPSFLAKAKKWQDAIAKGETPSIEEEKSANKPSGIFGLIS